MPRIHPYKLNVVGDFFVEYGCCLSCGVPAVEAPDLFGDSTDGCFVKKQPSTPVELDQMLNAMAAQDIGCIRYKGADGAILDRLRAIDDGRWIAPPDCVGVAASKSEPPSSNGNTHDP